MARRRSSAEMSRKRKGNVRGDGFPKSPADLGRWIDGERGVSNGRRRRGGASCGGRASSGKQAIARSVVLLRMLGVSCQRIGAAAVVVVVVLRSSW